MIVELGHHAQVESVAHRVTCKERIFVKYSMGTLVVQL